MAHVNCVLDTQGYRHAHRYVIFIALPLQQFPVAISMDVVLYLLYSIHTVELLHMLYIPP